MPSHVERWDLGRVTAVAACLAVAACGHSAAESKTAAVPSPVAVLAEPTVEAPPVAPPEPSASPEPAPASGSDDPESSAEAYLEALMNGHFLITISARNAVMDGDLAALRRIVDPLAEYEYPAEVPAGWAARLDDLQSAARRTVQARTLDHAALGVAAMAKVCGDCHLETCGEGQLRSELPKGPTAPSDTLAQRMDRHAWALGELWIGLTGPSDTAWMDGATALAEAPPKMVGANTSARGDMRPELKSLRTLGTDARSAKTSDVRAELYGRALATCAYCHTFGPEKRD